MCHVTQNSNVWVVSLTPLVSFGFQYMDRGVVCSSVRGGVGHGGRVEGTGRVADIEGVLNKHAATFWIATRNRTTVRALLAPPSLHSLSTRFQQPQLGLR